MPPPGTKPVRSVRRCLFGKLNDASMKALGEELETKLEEQLQEKAQKWDFDFAADRPLNEAELEPLSLEEVPSFYHPKVYKKGETRDLHQPSTSMETSVRITRAASKLLQSTSGTENRAPPPRPLQKQASIINFVTISKRRSGHLYDSGVTPKKMSRAHSDDPESSPFRYASAEAEKRFSEPVSPQGSPKKSPRKGVKPAKKISPKKGALLGGGRLRRNISSIV